MLKIIRFFLNIGKSTIIRSEKLLIDLKMLKLGKNRIVRLELDFADLGGPPKTKK